MEEELEKKGCFFENRIYPEGASVCDLEKCRVCIDGRWDDGSGNGKKLTA